MLKAKMIPKVVVEAAVSTWLNSDGTVRQDITETIAAALNAWPGVELDEAMWSGGTNFIVLPLTEAAEPRISTEDTNDKA